MATRFGYLKTSLSGLLLLPLLLAADMEYHGKTAGDEAFRQEDYSTAASFYEQYMKEAHEAADAAGVRAAMERRIDALILGKFPDAAKQMLREYKQRFPGADPVAVTMWTADLLLLQNKPAEARRNIERILPALTVDNPRRTHAVLSLARANEMLGNYSSAAELYFSVGNEMNKNKSFFTRSSKPGKLQIAAWERGIFCLSFTSNTDEAFRALAGHPDPNDPDARKRLRLLTSLLMIKSDSGMPIPAVWKKIGDLKDFDDNELSYPIFSAVGDHAAREGLFEIAAEAYAAAYQNSPGKEDSFQTLRRLLAVINASGNKNEAADLALKILEYFRGDYASVKFKEEIATILLNAEKFNEAADLFTDLAKNPAAAAGSKHHAMSHLAKLSAKITLSEEAVQLLDSYFTGSQKKGEREFLFAEALQEDQKWASAAEKYLEVSRKYSEWRIKALYQAAYCGLKCGNPMQTLNVLTDLFREDLTDQREADALFLKARALEEAGKNAEAWKEFEKYSLHKAKTESFTIDALYRAGRLAFLSGESVKAIKLFDRLIREYPRKERSAEAANWKIYIYRFMKDDYQADKATYELSFAWPDAQITFNARYQMAENNFSTESYSKVAQTLEVLYRDAKTDQNRIRVLCGQAALALCNKKFAEAKAFLDRLEKEFPGNKLQAEADYLRGDVARAESDFKLALQYYKKTLAASSGTYLTNAALGSIGDCYIILAGKNEPGISYADALNAYEQLLAKSPADPGLKVMTLYKAGRASELNGNDDKAMDYYKRALYLVSGFSTPAGRLWCSKAAEAIYSIAERRPIRQHIEEANKALMQLEKYQIISVGTAKRRTEILRQSRFRPYRSK